MPYESRGVERLGRELARSHIDHMQHLGATHRGHHDALRDMWRQRCRDQPPRRRRVLRALRLAIAKLVTCAGSCLLPIVEALFRLTPITWGTLTSHRGGRPPWAPEISVPASSGRYTLSDLNTGSAKRINAKSIERGRRRSLRTPAPVGGGGSFISCVYRLHLAEGRPEGARQFLHETALPYRPWARDPPVRSRPGSSGSTTAGRWS